MSLKSINPYTLETDREYPESPADEMLRIVGQCAFAQNNWKTVALSKRVETLKQLAKHLRQGAGFHAKTITREMGKPISEAFAEIEKCATLCDHYAQFSPEYLTGREIASNYSQTLVRYEPMGIFLSIMPWNFPYWQVFRAVVPAIMAGNGCILKHASNVTTCSLAIESLFQSAGFPMDLMRSIPVSGSNTALLIAHPEIVGISFTGSNPVGEKIAGLAGTQTKKNVLELGGSDPSIVLEDADLELAAKRCVAGRMLNAGQSCIASKRILVADTVAKAFIALVKTEIAKIQLGNPMAKETTMGPLANESIRDEIRDQVQRSIASGACAWVSEHHQSIALKGCMYPPTLLTNVTPGMAVWDEETFGPVMCVTTFSSQAEAVSLANQTEWGLGSSVYSQSIERAMEVGKQIQAGTCSINDFVKSDPRIPFGGVKKSGYGRELSVEGIREFTNVKTYNIA